MNIRVEPGAYGALPEEFCRYETASIAILPVPYDVTSTWMKGADRGPQALLEASANLELYDIETDSEVFKHGIVTVDPVPCPEEPGAMVAAVYERARRLLMDGKFIVGIGGEHTISVGLVQAAATRFANLSVLQFDAHADTRNEYEGSRYNHACVMSRIGEICPYVQAGIRSMDSSELKTLNRDRTFFAHEILKGPDVTSRALKALTKNVPANRAGRLSGYGQAVHRAARTPTRIQSFYLAAEFQSGKEERGGQRAAAGALGRPSRIHAIPGPRRE